MAYFSKQWTEEIVLPDGEIAGCMQDVERYLRKNGLASAGDYSDAFRRNVKFNREKACRKELFAEFVNNYKRRIWNATDTKTTAGN